MQGYNLSWSTLVYRYMMPCKQPEQLRARFSNLSIRNEPTNPIRAYKRSKQLPSPPQLTSPDVGFGKDIECFLYFFHAMLPDWLVALQSEVASLLSPKVNVALKRSHLSKVQESKPPQHSAAQPEQSCSLLSFNSGL